MNTIKFPKYYLRGQMVLFDPDEAIAVLKHLKDGRERLLGFDAFKLIGEDYKYIQPYSEHSVDYTSSSYHSTKDNYEDAIERIEALKNQGFVFEIVHQKVDSRTMETLVKSVFG
ncbi:hypothetical protein [Oligoflexus tunisiensis]|uniref:hypothetical protein n=1 Tax=Oligoflexus tunisiensis TaxID=708132 RepID=UPI00114C959A|nr:hypothetical protein [Oligoflexus tunisiensis]